MVERAAQVPGRTRTTRLAIGLELLKAERAPWLVFTGGWSPRSPDAAPEGDINRLHAIAHGVAPERVLTSERVRNTAEEAIEVAALLRRHRAGDPGDAPHALLVTSTHHMPRAVALFERQGLHITPDPIDFRQDAARRASLRLR